MRLIGGSFYPTFSMFSRTPLTPPRVSAKLMVEMIGSVQRANLAVRLIKVDVPG